MTCPVRLSMASTSLRVNGGLSSMPRLLVALPCGSASMSSHPVAPPGEDGGEVDGDRRFPDATLLVADGEDSAAHALSVLLVPTLLQTLSALFALGEWVS